MFRAKRAVDDEPGAKFIRSKYRCRACFHELKERIPAPPESKTAEGAA